MLCDELKVYVPQDGPWGLEPEEGGKLVEEETCYLKSDVDAAIAELKAKLENVQASMYADVVDANMENRRLRRALYKACANWADVVAFEETEGIGHDNSVAERWRKMERKCLKKAEEYK
ncbi:MAG: hypothetical protein VZR28_10770 [Candidatus Cryptobacteroides sp.]|nr:hypothetical protein [Candidatus Cryptobacteroides sp.]